jgi:hypothetical protein
LALSPTSVSTHKNLPEDAASTELDYKKILGCSLAEQIRTRKKMIDSLEIMEFSREVGLAPEVVEKDYVLGWVLGGIFINPLLRMD